MNRRKVTFSQGKYYHLYNRGAHRASIFREEANYLFVLRQLKTYCRQFEVQMVAYCLMPNHFHLLVRQDGEANAGHVVQYTFNSYTKAYNKRYGHSGTLFEGAYKVIPVEAKAHLLHLCRYIHINPVKDGLVSRPEEWVYSNYHEWLGERQGSLYDARLVEAWFGGAAGYRGFVEEYLRVRRESAEFEAYLLGMG